MAAPLLGIPILAKALTALKGGKMLAAGANAAKYAAGVPGATKQLALNLGGEAVKSGIKENIARAGIGAIRDKATKEAGKSGIMRFAGDALRGTKNFLVESAGSPADMAVRLVPDVGLGLFYGATAPGDLGDKLITGTSTALGGGLGGLAAGGAIRKLGGGSTLQTVGDLAGSMVGDMVGMSVGDSVMRVKGGGMTPYEKQYALQDEARKQQILDEFLMANGLG